MKQINLTHLLCSVIIVLIIAAPVNVVAQEHPAEHPQDKAALNPETLAKEIEQYAKNESKLKGGYFLLYDEKSKTPLALTLDKVHKDKLSKVGDDVYFACSDFKGTDGKNYDVDFFMKKTESGLELTELTVHKVNGKARYTWYEDSGVWKQKEK